MHRSLYLQQLYQTKALPMQELVGHCLQLFQENQARIQSLEEYLQQYGYKSPHHLSTSVNPLELVQSHGKLVLPAICCY